MRQTYLDECIQNHYIPTDSEVMSIRAALTKPTERIATIEKEIGIAELWIQHLKQDKKMLLNSLEKYHVLISPARRLPDDILREIFKWCLPVERNPSMSAAEAPMLLTRVSSHWRSVALTSPRMWSALHIAVPNPFPRSLYDPETGKRIPASHILQHRLRGVAEWLSRSGCLPLCFSLHDVDNSSYSGYGKQFAQILVPYAPRWKEISLQCSPDTTAPFEQIQSAHVPLLEVLHVQPTIHASSQWRKSDILKAPKLREVSIHGLLEGFSDLPLIWEQLTHLTMMGGQWLDGSLTMAQMGQILGRCTRLTSCKLRLAGGASISHERHELPQICLPNLTELCIFEMQAQTPFFFAAIDAPKLISLEYWFDGTPKYSPSGFSTLLSKVGKTLQILSTNPTTLDSNEFNNGLWSCTHLTTLVLCASEDSAAGSYIEGHTSPTSNHLLESFAEAFNGKYLCPKLDTFRCLIGANFSDEAVLKFIVQKQAGQDQTITKLKLVDISMTRGPTLDILTVLSNNLLVSETPVIDLRYPSLVTRGPFSLYQGLTEALVPKSHRVTYSGL